MARKADTAATATKGVRKRAARKRSTPRIASQGATQARAPLAAPSMQGFGDMAKMAKAMTPEQAIELYKANAQMALDIINAAIEGTAKVRRLQFAGEESARDFQRKAVKSATEARDPQSLMAVSQGAAQEALEKSMHYWGEMFDLMTEIQRRLFTLIEEQAEGMPGVKQAKAAMAMMPDFKPLANVVDAMRGVVGSGTNAFEQMQKVMGDFARVAQHTMPGARR